MKFSISKRGVVRIVSFFLALIIVLTVSMWINKRKLTDYKSNLEATYLRAINQISSDIDGINNTLNKVIYAGTPDMLSKLIIKIWNDAQNCKTNLSQLPIDYFNLSQTYKFLSQVGNYSMSLLKNVLDDKPLTEEEFNNIKILNQYSKKFFDQIAVLQDRVQSGNVSFEKITSNLQNGGQQTVPPEINDDFIEFESGFNDYPSLIYDGPFSNHILEKKPLLIQNDSEVTIEQARERAAWALQLEPSQLKDDGEEAGNMPCYRFKANDYTISMTKQGGLISYILSSRLVSERTLAIEQAIEKSKVFLELLKIYDLKDTYYEISNNIMTVNYANYQDGVTVYPDLIKVSVAMDNGQILGFDARGYITNKTQREVPKNIISKDIAKSKINPLLKVVSENMVIIPTEGLNENYAYEFLCQDENGQKVLVYIDAITGKEKDILILLINENGILTV